MWLTWNLSFSHAVYLQAVTLANCTLFHLFFAPFLLSLFSRSQYSCTRNWLLVNSRAPEVLDWLTKLNSRAVSPRQWKTKHVLVRVPVVCVCVFCSCGCFVSVFRLADFSMGGRDDTDFLKWQQEMKKVTYNSCQILKDLLFNFYRIFEI